MYLLYAILSVNSSGDTYSAVPTNEFALVSEKLCFLTFRQRSNKNDISSTNRANLAQGESVTKSHQIKFMIYDASSTCNAKLLLPGFQFLKVSFLCAKINLGITKIHIIELFS